MPSTYSNLKIQLMATGENNTTWGDVTNLNLGTALEEAIVGSADVAFSNANVTLTLTDTNASQTARNMRLNLTGTATAGYNLVVPAIEKPYIINNGTDGTITVKNSTGTGIAVPAGKTMWVYNDGTNVVDAVTRLSSLTLGTDLAVADGGTGASTFTSNGVLIGNGTSAITATAAGTTGQVLVGNTGSAPTWATLSTSAVTSFSAGTTGFTPNSATTGAITLAGTLNVANGGTGATSLTSGYLVKGNGTSAASASVVYDDGTSVGIGTTSPGAKLDVNGLGWFRANASANGIDILGRSSDNAGQLRILTNNAASTLATLASYGNDVALLNNTASYSLLLGTNSTERMRIDSSGNVGIGTSSPSTYNGLLNVKASDRAVIGYFGGTSYATRLGANSSYATVEAVDAATGVSSYQPLQIGGSLVKFDTGGSERMRIDASGNVGIGTSSPGARLDVRAANIADGTNGGIVNVYSTTTQAANVGGKLDLGGLYDGSNSLSFASVAGRKENSTSGDWSGYMQFSTRRFGGDFAERMRIDSSGNVGIGSSSPGTAVDVYRNTAATASYRIQNANTAYDSNFIASDGSGSAAFGYAGSTYGGYQGIVASGSYWYATGAGGIGLTTWNASAAIKFFTNSGSERMRITSNGSVGIGTSSPQGLFHVVAGTNDTLIFRGPVNLGTGGSIYAVNTSNTNVTPMEFGASNYYFAGGNVGIGTTSPADKLHVEGAISARSGSNGFVALQTGSSTNSGYTAFYNGSSTRVGYIGYANNSSGAFLINSEVATNAMTFSTNATERARIDSNGYFFVGTTALVADSTNASGLTYIPGDYIGVATQASGNACAIFNKTNSAAGLVVSIRYNATEVGSITNTSTATAYNTSSDYRLKDIDGPLQNSGAYIDALKPVQGSWKADGSRFIGLIAHEVQEVSETQIATGVKDGEEMQAMDYSAPELIANLIAEIQSLRARVAQLEGN